MRFWSTSVRALEMFTNNEQRQTKQNKKSKTRTKSKATGRDWHHQQRQQMTNKQSRNNKWNQTFVKETSWWWGERHTHLTNDDDDDNSKCLTSCSEIIYKEKTPRRSKQQKKLQTYFFVCFWCTLYAVVQQKGTGQSGVDYSSKHPPHTKTRTHTTILRTQRTQRNALMSVLNGFLLLLIKITSNAVLLSLSLSLDSRATDTRTCSNASVAHSPPLPINCRTTLNAAWSYNIHRTPPVLCSLRQQHRLLH